MHTLFEKCSLGVVHGEQLEFCESIKNLGVIFDSNMNFQEHNSEKLQKVYGVLIGIRHIRHIMPTNVKRVVACALIDPILSYGDVISYGWGAHNTADQENRIRIADNDKIRYIFGLKRSEHTSEYRERVNGLTPESKAKLHSATLIYKQLKTRSPVYLNDMFVFNEGATRSNGQLRVLVKPHSEFDKRAFGFAAIAFYNSIPVDIKERNTIGSFKFHLKNWLRNNQQ